LVTPATLDVISNGTRVLSFSVTRDGLTELPTSRVHRLNPPSFENEKSSRSVRLSSPFRSMIGSYQGTPKAPHLDAPEQEKTVTP